MMKNNINDFDDVPAGQSISYEHLMFYLEEGREIEFIYQGKEYFISNSSEGRAIWMGKTRVSEYYGTKNKEFTEAAKINGLTLKQLFQDEKNEVEVTAVF